MSEIFKFKYGQLVIHDDDSYEYSEDFPLELRDSLYPFLKVIKSLKRKIDKIFNTDKYNFSKGIILKLSSFVEGFPEVSHLFTRIKIKNKNDIEKELNNSFFKHLHKIFSSFDDHYKSSGIDNLTYVVIRNPYIWAHAALKYYTFDSHIPFYKSTYYTLNHHPYFI